MHQSISHPSNRMKIRLILTPICAAIVQAHAAEPVPPAAQSDTLTVVVVEARKVKENQQAVPLSVTNYTGGELAKQGVTDFNEVARETPNVLIRPHVSGATAAVIAIRGQVSNDIVGTLDSPIGVYLDGVVSSRPTGLNSAMVDLQSMSTLKGPQGTLFGRNTTGGAILIKTNDPDLKEFGGKMSAEVGSYNLRHATAVMNVPLQTDVAALRFVIDKADHDGFLTDKNGQKWNDSHSKLGRVKLAVTPTSTSSIVASAESIDSNGTAVAQAYKPGVEANLTGVNAPALYPFNFAKQRNFSLVASNEFDWGVLKLTAGLRKLESDSNVDITAVGFLLANSKQYKPEGAQKSVELQANGHALNDRLAWTAGIYGFKEDAHEHQTTDYLKAVIGVSGSVTDADIVSKTHAVYVQGSYEVLDATKLTVGVRNSSDEKTVVGNAVTYVAPGVGITSPTHGGTKSFAKTNYLVSLDYTFGKDKLVYVSHSTGYRAGGFNMNSQFSSFDPETVVNSEIGVKSEWLGRKLRVNAAFYKQDYRNFQITLILGSPPMRVVDNANGKIKGGEIEISAVPMDGMRTGLTYGQTDTEYTSTALKGQAFAQVPKSTASLYASYRTNLSVGAWENRIDYSRTSAINFATGSTTGEAMAPGFDLINMRTSLEMQKWDVALWVKNAGNKKYFNNVLTAIGTLGWVGMPRTVGVSASYVF